MCAVLTTLAEVRLQLSMDDGVIDHDPLLEMLIARATDAIQRHTGCEFVSAAHDDQDPVEPVARRVLDTGGILRLTPWEAREITSVVIDPDGEQPLTLDATQYRTLPFASIDGVFHSIDLLTGSSCSGRSSRVVEVTGLWGWATIPPAVKQAAEATVVHWYRVHAQHQKNGGDDVDRYGPVAFPTMARMLLDPYRFRRGV